MAVSEIETLLENLAVPAGLFLAQQTMDFKNLFPNTYSIKNIDPIGLIDENLYENLLDKVNISSKKESISKRTRKMKQKGRNKSSKIKK